MPLLVPGNQSPAIFVLSLGAVASTWVGAAIVVIISTSLGIIWIFAGMYVLSAVLMLPLRDPARLTGAAMPAPAHRASGGPRHRAGLARQTGRLRTAGSHPAAPRPRWRRPESLAMRGLVLARAAR
jgi:hypothetical protein